jgi:putative IMPACT (imprinted ancient) family translation regulator
MIRLDHVVSDRGSRYSVNGGVVQGRAGAEAFVKALKRDKKFAKATHNSWAILLSAEGAVKNDDGESGAGAVILRMLEREGLSDCIIVVTRWYGGVHLGGDRFAHVVTCVRAFLQAWRAAQGGGESPGAV